MAGPVMDILRFVLANQMVKGGHALAHPTMLWLQSMACNKSVSLAVEHWIRFRRILLEAHNPTL